MRRTGDDLDLAASFDGADIDPQLLGGADLPPFEGEADLTIKDGVNLARFGGSLRGHSGTIRTLSLSSGGTAGLYVAGPFSVGADGLLDADLKVSVRDPKGVVGAARQGVSGEGRADRGEPSGPCRARRQPVAAAEDQPRPSQLGFIPLGEMPPL